VTKKSDSKSKISLFYLVVKKKQNCKGRKKCNLAKRRPEEREEWEGGKYPVGGTTCCRISLPLELALLNKNKEVGKKREENDEKGPAEKQEKGGPKKSALLAHPPQRERAKKGYPREQPEMG